LIIAQFHTPQNDFSSVLIITAKVRSLPEAQIEA